MKFLRRKNLQPSESSGASFTDSTFASREKFRECYDVVANSLCRHLDFDCVLDVGCANGFLLEFLDKKQKEVRGIELSHDALNFIPDHLKKFVTIGDATQMKPQRRFDLVTCIEVAEHIHQNRSDALVDFLTASSIDHIYFTAAYPDQPGHGHINCQPQFFWMRKFHEKGYEVNWSKSQSLINDLQELSVAPWLSMNSLVFSKPNNTT